jgi:glycosyltransferase involved in cell wall biosynthesis
MSSRLKVAYDYQIFGGQKYGGISRYFFELANHISQLDGVSASIVAPLYINSYLNASHSNLKIIGKSVPVVKGTWQFYRLYNALVSPSKIAMLAPDIVHETYYSDRYALRRGARTVLTVYDMIHELFPNSFRRSDNTSELKMRAIERADHIICISKTTQRDLVNHLNISVDKTSVIYLGVQLENSKLSLKPIRNRPYLLYVGSRGGYKNFKTTLEMYGTHPWVRDGYDLVFFGGGPLDTNEQALLNNFNLSDRQVCHETGGDAALVNLYQNAAVFIYPSFYEGFGIPPLEAMSCRCPVVSSNAGAMPEILGDAAEFFDPFSASSMADAIQRIVCNDQHKDKLIQLGLDRAAQFSWEKCAKDTLEVYQNLSH